MCPFRHSLTVEMTFRCVVNKIIESLRDDLAVLSGAGAISKVTMREFDAICPPTVRKLGAR